ncbi:MAG TPA: tRNA pseudouridine(55) synthase TruB [Candidatus Kapabacteria bacterium]|nr:tRNA pseudouridine(55) synthase TruB [Candidatus Kapabacteria bacterium]
MLITKHNIGELNLSKQELLEQGCTFLINKELTWTSSDVVSKFRSLFKTKKVGHAGSLDPFATGLLVISIGKDTKKINSFIDTNKCYIGTVKFGAETVSYDAEHPEIRLTHIDNISPKLIEAEISSFIGKLQQTAPIYSAKKHNGRRHYDLARKNIAIEPKIKEVEIFNISIKDIYMPFCEFEVECSKGTYIRSIAYDLGKKLDNSAYLFKLIRTQVGEFSLEDALKINEITQYLK